MLDRLKSGARILAIVAGTSAVFAWFGVYGTSRIPFLTRFSFWFMTMAIGGLASHLVLPWVRNGLLARFPVPFKIALAAALISIPVTVSVVLYFNGGELNFYQLRIQFIYVFVVSAVLTTIGWYFGWGKDTPVTDDDVNSSADVTTRFLERLPVKYRAAELYAVSSEDHYLRIHTSLGEELILMRLADAVRELASADGLQTHRSWWVAKGGVADSRREEGKLVLVLKSGAEAAVSRRYLPEVKAAGLG